MVKQFIDKMKNKDERYQFLLNSAIYWFMFIIIVIVVALDVRFLSVENFSIMLTQASTRIIFALGVGGIIVLGGTDLSVGRQVGLAAVVSASMLQAVDYGRKIFPDLPQLPVVIPIIIVMLVCALFSVIQGVVVARLKVAPFIASLGMNLVIYGVNSMYYNGIAGSAPIGGFSPSFTAFAQSGIMIGSFKLYYIIIWAAIVSVIIWFIWNKTVLGRNMYAIGGNREAAKVSGVNVVKNMLLVYLIAGLTYGFGGSLEAARTGSANNTLGASYELDAIAACVVGGVSMHGGVGNVGGIIIGVLLFQIINYGLVFTGVSPDVQYVVKGIIIIFAVAIDTQKYVSKDS